MKKHVTPNLLWRRLLATFLFACCFISNAYSANEATVYKHCNYSTSGYAINLSVGNYTTAQLAALGIVNNDISSIRIISGYEILLYDADNFTGTPVTIRADVSCLTSLSFNDRASSVRVRSINPPVTTVYKHCDYSTSGYGIALPAGEYTTAQLTSLGISNNDISSIRINNGYEILLYDADNFTGTPVIVRADITCLTNVSFNDRTSSLRVRVANLPPAVSITSPANNTVVTAPTSVTINTTATDSDGTISKVDFYAGTTLLGTVTTAPYSLVWNVTTAGSYSLTAVATDNNGATTTSTAIAVQANTVIITDLTDLPGVISAQYTDSPTNENIDRLTDNNVNSKYLTFHNTGWVQFQRTTASVVTSYTITSANDAPERDPLNWIFQASLNGTDWATLDTRNNEDFPNRFQKKEYSFSNTTAYTHFRLQLTNNSGSILQLAEWEIFGTVTITSDWDNFRYPEINFENHAPTHAGSVVFNTAMPDPVSDMRAQILKVVKKIYYNDHDNILTFNKLNFYLEDYDGVAYKAGSPPEITIVVSVRHIQNVYNNSGGNYEAIRTEILGILSHEGTHGYQYEPRNAGGYTPGTDMYGFIEGLADYVRISVGLHPGRVPSTGGSWTSGYTTSGFFINWLVRYKDPDFAIKLNHTARTYATWSWDAACQEILGTGVQTLWNEYQAWLQSGGSFSRVAAVTVPYPLEKTTCALSLKTTNTNSGSVYELYFDSEEEALYVNSPETDAVNHIYIYNASGILLKEAFMNGSGNMNAADLPQGMCIVRIENSSGDILTEKVIISR